MPLLLLLLRSSSIRQSGEIFFVDVCRRAFVCRERQLILPVICRHFHHLFLISHTTSVHLSITNDTIWFDFGLTLLRR